MIYTFTLNPCIDYYVELPEKLLKDEVNRGFNERYKAGGKGLNVSRILSLYGLYSTAVCLLGGFTGEFIRHAFDDNPLVEIFPLNVNGISRINVKAFHGTDGYVINGTGPFADEKTRNALIRITNGLQEKDVVIIAGSMMKGLDEDFLINFCQRIHEHKALLALDMEFKNIHVLQACRPDIIKPNLYELGILLKNDSIGPDDAVKKAHLLQQEGIADILVSLGKDGAVLVSGQETYRMDQPHTVLVNKAGAGDAMLASYIAVRLLGKTKAESLQYAGAAGNAAASVVRDITMNDIQTQLGRIKISRL